MEILNAENCQECFRPISDAGAKTKTQWFTACRCDRPYVPNFQFSIDVCANCKRRVPFESKSSFDCTSLCLCENPNRTKVPTHLKPNETDSVSIDLASFRIPSDSFPTEKYSPLAFLGDTPRATTILARDRARGTKVAVKCFKRVKPELHATFQSEAKKNQQLTHTNIAKMVDISIHNAKTPYLVTEYKDGFNLSQHIALYGIPSHDVAIKILIGICETLIYAQKQSVLHRDLRPENVIFMDDTNSEPSVVLTDFGLPKTKFAESPLEPWDALYLSGDEARNMDFTEKSELYAIGNIGYLLLTGKAPFQEGSYLEIKNSHALKLPPRISNINFDKKRPSELEEIIEKCMEKDPNVRFESVQKLLERLEVFPRRLQYQIDTVLAARKRAKFVKIVTIGSSIAVGLGFVIAGILAFRPH